MRDFSEMPADLSWPLLGNIPQISAAGELHEYLLDLHRRRGEIVRFDLGRRAAFSTASPEHLAKLSNTGFDERPDLMRPFMGWLGDGNIAFKSGRESRRTRAKLIPLLTGSVLQQVCEFGTLFTDQVLDEIEDASNVDALAALHAVTLRSMGACCFGEDFARGPGADIGHRFMRVLRDNPLDVGSMLKPVWKPGYWRWLREVRELHAKVHGLIESRRQLGNESGGDLLGLLLSAEDEDGGRFFSEEEARMAVLAFYFGGVDATAAASLWTCALLAKHPEVQRRVHEELDTVLAGRAPALSDLGALTELSAVVQETLRLFPPNPLNMRRIEKTRELGGFEIPEDTVFFLSIIALHRSERLWEAPLEFRPERFSQESSSARHRYAYIPFGIGAKSCIGSRFAMAQVQLIVARILQRRSIRAVAPIELEAVLRSGVLFPARAPSLAFDERTPFEERTRPDAAGLEERLSA